VSDILERLAACIAGTVTPEDRDAITLEACAEIVRLRLTAWEREAIVMAASVCDASPNIITRNNAAMLRSLLERTK
jgi:hypothetical protein